MRLYIALIVAGELACSIICSSNALAAEVLQNVPPVSLHVQFDNKNDFSTRAEQEQSEGQVVKASYRRGSGKRTGGNSNIILWNMINQSGYAIEYAFYKPNGVQVSPVYNPTGNPTNTSACSPGERICYGAWSVTDPDRVWGMGKGDDSCNDCCMSCGGPRKNVHILP